MHRINISRWILATAFLFLSGSAGFEQTSIPALPSAIPEWVEKTHVPGQLTIFYSQRAKLNASDAEENDYFGQFAAISGDTLVVGARKYGEIGDPLTDAGAAYVFERDLGGTGSWGVAAKLTASDAQAFDQFGRSIAIDTDTIVAGSVGAAYVFERNLGGTNNWGEAVKLTASDIQVNGFGASVAISGDTILVGAPEFKGAAYVFERDLGGPGNWGEAAKLIESDYFYLDYFGQSVAISGDTIVVGLDVYDVGPSNWPVESKGAAYVFERDFGGTGSWGEAAMLSAGDTDYADKFGNSVSINGDTIVIGAEWVVSEWDTSLNGAAYVYERDYGGTGSWGEVAKLTAADAQNLDYFGTSVAIRGDTIVVGVPAEDGGPGDPLPSSGSAYIFERDSGGSGSWGQVFKLKASDAQEYDLFGKSVAVGSTTIVVTATLEDGGPGDPVLDTGTAYVFEPLVLQNYLPLIAR